MKISGFTFIRNGIKLSYPFLESIQSILPICDEVIVAVGNSEDATRDSLTDLNSPKIKLIDTVWDDSIRTGGAILAQQTDMAWNAISGDWGFYLQGDEVVHENNLPVIVKSAEKYLHEPKVEGLLFRYLHFYGNYHYVSKPHTRGTYPFEVRLIKKNKQVRSFRDAQGFRKYPAGDMPGKQTVPSRLRVKKIDACIYHYGKVRGPVAELERSRDFHKLWHDDQWVSKLTGDKEVYDYQPPYPLVPFQQTHPAVMTERIKKLDWDFRYDASAVRIPFRHRIMNLLEATTGWRPFDFRNYTILP